MSTTTFWNRWIAILGERSRRRNPEFPQLSPLSADRITRDQIDELRVVVSSPLKGLEQPRALTLELIGRLPGASADLFEFDPATGRCIKDACRHLIQRADIVVVLIGNERGSQDPGTGQTYSAFELELLRARQQQPDSLGRPRVFVFLHKIERTLEHWEEELEQAYGAFREDDPEELAWRIAISVTEALLDERKQQVVAFHNLAELTRHKLDALETALKMEIESLSHREQALSNLREVERTASSNELERLRQEEQSRESRVKEAVDAREALALQRVRDLRFFLFGSIAIAIVFLVAGAAISLGASGNASEMLGRQTFAIERSADALDAISRRLSAPAEIVAAKTRVAKALNARFDCSIEQESDWAVEATMEIRFSRREVCESLGALVLRVVPEGRDCEMRILHAETAQRLVQALRNARVRVTSVQIIGHASVDTIRGTCGLLDPKWLAVPDTISRADLQVRDNTQLAWARAAAAAYVLRQADPSLPISSRQVGALGVLSTPRLGRRVDIEMRILPIR